MPVRRQPVTWRWTIACAKRSALFTAALWIAIFGLHALGMLGPVVEPHRLLLAIPLTFLGIFGLWLRPDRVTRSRRKPNDRA